MKTLLITLEYPPFNGGVANYYGNMVKYWPLQEKIEVLYNERQELLSKQGLFPWRKSINQILAKSKKRSFDYLLVGQLLPLGTAAYLSTWLKKINYGIIIHGLDFTLATKNSWKKFLTRLIFNRADKIICANSQVANLVKIFSKKNSYKVFIVNPGIEPIIPTADCNKVNEIRNQYQLENYFSLITVGRLVLRKGVDQVISALSSLEPNDPQIKYFIIGKGPEEAHLKALQAHSPQKDNIHFLGEINETDKWCWLYACDAFIMPARQINEDFEGFGIVYLEANLASKPVIAGNSGGIRDAVENEINGLLVDPDNTLEIKKAILRLATDNVLKKQLGERGRERALTNFRWEKQSERLLKILKS